MLVIRYPFAKWDFGGAWKRDCLAQKPIYLAPILKAYFR